ncbi:MAG TPA: SDR family NAD(P)-dependent oxidoreductase [Acidimicrobiales bacterium]|nr:SDR family NAD(P)-dependent oxidoreductase [Acidimicrobiales bacterium]
MSDLASKVVVVTGASRGIGAAIARRFAADGAAVAVTARTVEDGDHPLPGSLASTVRSIEAAAGTALPVAADLARPVDRQQLVDTVERELGPVDVLVNNAAVTYMVPVVDFDDRRYEVMFEVQVHAPFDLARRVLPGMRERRSGWILNISSPAAIHPKGPPFGAGLPGGTVYGMCKAALERFTTGLAAEVYAEGIAVNVLSPAGLVPTPGVVHHHLHEMVPEEMHEPVDVMAEAAHALCTGDPASLTGMIAFSRPLLAELGLDVPS